MKIFFYLNNSKTGVCESNPVYQPLTKENEHDKHCDGGTERPIAVLLWNTNQTRQAGHYNGRLPTCTKSSDRHACLKQRQTAV